MTTKHTPGPWVRFCDQGRTIAIMPAGRPDDICTMAGGATEADATLIAAAPELLAAAEAVLALDEGEELCVQCVALRDAVAKAKGEVRS